MMDDGKARGRRAALSAALGLRFEAVGKKGRDREKNRGTREDRCARMMDKNKTGY